METTKKVRRVSMGRRAMRGIAANGIVQIARSLRFAVRNYYPPVEILQIIDALQGQITLFADQYDGFAPPEDRALELSESARGENHEV